MSSEDSPLLTEQSAQNVDPDVVALHEAVYDRFSVRRKKVIVALSALAGTFPMFTSGSFLPLIPQIAEDMHSTGQVVSLAVSLSILGNCIGSMIWAGYSAFYGRRPILLISLAIMCVGSVGAGMARTVPELLIWRVTQAFGASSGLSVGIGVLADIFKMEERGSASGIFFGSILLGMSLAPAVGGVMAHYYSWRATQYGLFVAGFVSLVLTWLFQPETSQPGARGVDKLIRSEGKARWVWLNPFQSVALLRSPNVLLVSLSQGLVVITDYVLLIPIAYTIAAKYDIINEALIGMLCLPVGIGNIIGSTFAGRLSDRLLISWRKRRGGVWVPEDRLRATISGGLILAPCSIIASGIVTQYMDNNIANMILNFVCLFLNGIGVSILFNPSNAYLVDILHSRSAEVTAANMYVSVNYLLIGPPLSSQHRACRNLVVALSVGFIIPSLNTFGIAITFAGAAVISWIGFALTITVISHGGRMRAFVDLGFSTLEDN